MADRTLRGASSRAPSGPLAGRKLRSGTTIRSQAYLIAATKLRPDQQEILDELGFEELYRPQVTGGKAQALWYKP